MKLISRGYTKPREQIKLSSHLQTVNKSVKNKNQIRRLQFMLKQPNNDLNIFK